MKRRRRERSDRRPAREESVALTRRGRVFHIALSSSLVLLGLVVLVGWHVGYYPIVQVAPAWAPVQYNTALCFVATGAGLCVEWFGLRRTALIVGIGAATLPILTLLQYAMGIDLGVDEFFHDHALVTQTSSPGRMAPNTAFALIVLVSVLLLAASRVRASRRAVFVTILASLVLALGFVSLVGYGLGIEGAYGWNHSTRMALLSAVGFVLGGLAGLLMAWRVEPRFVPLTCAFATGVTFALFGFGNLRDHDVRRAELDFARIAGECSMLVRRHVSAVMHDFAVMAASLDASALASRENFEGTVTAFLRDHPAIISVEWLPRVRHDTRSSFEAAVAKEGSTDYRIREQSVEGDLEPAAARNVHYPVRYVEPLARNHRALGFDHASDSMRRAMVEKTIATGTLRSTTLIELPPCRDDATGRRGVLTYSVVQHSDGMSPAGSSEERQPPRGLLCVALDLARVVESAWSAFPSDLVELAVVDRSENAGSNGAGKHRITSGGRILWHAPSGSVGGLRQDATLDMGGRDFTVCAVATPEFVSAHKSWRPWIFLGAVLVLTLALTRALHRALRDSARVEALVDERTSDLRATNMRLEREIEQRRDAEDFVRRQNTKLETLLYVASHDLREPLRAIANFSRLIKADYASDVDDRANDYLGRISRAAERLDKLMESILALAKVERCEGSLAAVQARDVVEEALARLDERIRETGATVIIAGELPLLDVDPRWAVEAVHNLLANALKFTTDRAAPQIEIGAFAAEEERGIAVRDRGPGVPPDQRERIFDLFQRAVGREVEGTGTGLAIVRRIAEIHGGRAWTVGRAGGGAEFIITFPVQRQAQAT